VKTLSLVASLTEVKRQRSPDN